MKSHVTAAAAEAAFSKKAWNFLKVIDVPVPVKDDMN
jgi:hypothetical protein